MRRNRLTFLEGHAGMITRVSLISFAGLLLILITVVGNDLYPQVMTVGNIVQGVISDKKSYPLGAPVNITYAIRNQGNEPIKYDFPSAKQFDFWIMRGETEIYRFSKHQVYAQVLTTLTLQPNEVKRYEATWNQIDDQGNPIGPGTYCICAQLTPSSNQPPPVKTQIFIGTTGAAVVTLANIREAIRNASSLVGKTVYIRATYHGFQPTPGDPNTSAGPPVTRSDWVICDSTGCMYVTGTTTLDPQKDIGAQVNLTGKLQRTKKGQVYLVVVSVQKA